MLFAGSRLVMVVRRRTVAQFIARKLPMGGERCTCSLGAWREDGATAPGSYKSGRREAPFICGGICRTQERASRSGKCTAPAQLFLRSRFTPRPHTLASTHFLRQGAPSGRRAAEDIPHRCIRCCRKSRSINIPISCCSVVGQTVTPFRGATHIRLLLSASPRVSHHDRCWCRS